MLNYELGILNKDLVTYSILNKEPGMSNQIHIARYCFVFGCLTPTIRCHNYYNVALYLAPIHKRKPGQFLSDIGEDGPLGTSFESRKCSNRFTSSRLK